MNRVVRSLTRVACLFFVGAAPSCVADDAAGRVARHANASAWGDAVLGITRDPWQWGPAAALAVAVPVAFANDAGGSSSGIRNAHFSSHESDGDALLQGMMAVSGAVALGEWLYGDDGSAAEVLLESTLLTAGIVEFIKINHSRRRPEGSGSYDSFPSGHATTAFVAATFLARRVDDSFDGWKGYLGYLSYVPAAVVALNRVENARHFPSDVVVGALLGTLVTNIIYNAHYGSEGGHGIYSRPPVSFVTQIDDDSVGVGIQFRF